MAWCSVGWNVESATVYYMRCMYLYALIVSPRNLRYASVGRLSDLSRHVIVYDPTLSVL